MSGLLRNFVLSLSLAAALPLLAAVPAAAHATYDDNDDDDDGSSGSSTTRLKFRYSADLGRDNASTGVLELDYADIERLWTATSGHGSIAYGSGEDFGNLFEDRSSSLDSSTLRDIRRDDLPLLRILSIEDGGGLTTVFEFAVPLELTRIGQGNYRDWLSDGNLYSGLKNDARDNGEEIQIAFFADIAGLSAVAPTITAEQSDRVGSTVDFLTAPVRRIAITFARDGQQVVGSTRVPIHTAEPGSLALMLGGLAMLAWGRRRFTARARAVARL